MSRHSKIEISFYKGVETGVRSSIFHNHCSVSGTSSVSSNSKTADLPITKNFNSMIVLTEEARKELEWWVENLQLTKGKTLINPQPQITISTDASLEGWGGGGRGLLPRSKEEAYLDMSGEKRSYKYFRTAGSEVCNINFFSFASQSSITIHSNEQ